MSDEDDGYSEFAREKFDLSANAGLGVEPGGTKAAEPAGIPPEVLAKAVRLLDRIQAELDARG